MELNLFDSPLLLSRNNQGLQIEQEIMKRIIDIVGSLIGIVITIPIFLIVGICIKMTDGGPGDLPADAPYKKRKEIPDI